MATIPDLPRRIADIDVPQDEVSAATWDWIHRRLPAYLVAHSVRAYCWGVAIARREGWAFDARVHWCASLLHDLGLATIPDNTMCFEVEGAAFARRFLERAGLPADAADRAAIAIILHMRPDVTLGDGVEAVLLDRATSIDVRGAGFELTNGLRPAVMRAFPRGAFDRHFLAAMRREAAIRPTCQSAWLLGDRDLAGAMERSPWRSPAASSS